MYKYYQFNMKYINEYVEIQQYNTMNFEHLNCQGLNQEASRLGEISKLYWTARTLTKSY